MKKKEYIIPSCTQHIIVLQHFVSMSVNETYADPSVPMGVKDREDYI